MTRLFTSHLVDVSALEFLTMRRAYPTKKLKLQFFVGSRYPGHRARHAPSVGSFQRADVRNIRIEVPGQYVNSKSLPSLEDLAHEPLCAVFQRSSDCFGAHFPLRRAGDYLIILSWGKGRFEEAVGYLGGVVPGLRLIPLSLQSPSLNSRMKDEGPPRRVRHRRMKEGMAFSSSFAPLPSFRQTRGFHARHWQDHAGDWFDVRR
jgi:hypothetical protein